MIEKTLSPDPKRRMEALADLVHELEELPCGRTYKVTVEQVRSARSTQANAYYWGVVVEAIYQKVGYEPGEIHEFLCGERFGWKDRPVPRTPRNREGLESVPVRTTTHGPDGKRSVLSSYDFWEFVEFARRIAATRINVVVPDPDPSWKAEAA